ncbi:mas-related G-protein coupled receptor member X1-like isoform X2 [Monodelphis domestica]|uniref:mas-related G-protein coupled receptor member X1-like isoform X2 n=1 Tax=Monodelphis domestica TaxID=13616 RepID=UPI0024E204F5|nr:mas-related G-protein coupled receptor member X1-like isoform X2 [Monodelphis domestica]
MADGTAERTNGSFPCGGPGGDGFGDWKQILTMGIAVVGLLGNGLVLWLLGFRIPRSPFSVYILNLAAADALFLCGLFAFYLKQFIGSFNDVVTDHVMITFTFLFYHVGLSLLVAISTERCLSALFPLWYRCHRPKHTSAAVCALLWALAGLCCGIYCGLCIYTCDAPFCLAFPIALFVWFLLLTPLLCASSLALVLRVQCGSRRRQPPRFYLLVVLTVLVFLLCGVPAGIVDFLYVFSGLEPRHHLASLLLACVNSSANPFIYFFLGSRRRRRGREPLRVVLQRALGGPQEPESGGRDSLHTNTTEASARG